MTHLTSGDSLQCCDFYQEGQGYQFTDCDHGVGVYIFSDRKGTPMDLQYVNMPLASVGFNDLPWDQLY